MSHEPLPAVIKDLEPALKVLRLRTVYGWLAIIVSTAVAASVFILPDASIWIAMVAFYFVCLWVGLTNGINKNNIKPFILSRLSEWFFLVYEIEEPLSQSSANKLFNFKHGLFRSRLASQPVFVKSGGERIAIRFTDEAEPKLEPELQRRKPNKTFDAEDFIAKFAKELLNKGNVFLLGHEVDGHFQAKESINPKNTWAAIPIWTDLTELEAYGKSNYPEGVSAPMTSKDLPRFLSKISKTSLLVSLNPTPETMYQNWVPASALSKAIEQSIKSQQS